jgi:O-antigen/teichoic acid export membrane protein
MSDIRSGAGVAKSAATMVVLALLQRGLGFIAISILARILEPRGLGSYAFSQSTSQTFYGLSRIGADAGLHVSLAAIDRGETDTPARLLSEALTLFLAIACVGGFILWSLADPIADKVFGVPELSSIVPASALMFVGQVLGQYAYTSFAGLHAFAVYARLTAITGAITLAISVIGGFNFGPQGAIWGAAYAALGSGIVLCAGVARECRFRGLRLRPVWPGALALRTVQIGFPFYASGLLLIPVDFYCLGYLSRSFGVESLGDLRVVQSVLSIALMVPTALSGPFVSHLCSLTSPDKKAHGLQIQLKAVWVLSLGMTICLGGIWPLLVRAIFGASFPNAETTGAVALVVITPTMLLSALTGALLATQRTVALIAVSGVQALFVAICAREGIDMFGLGGLFGAQAIGMVLATLGLLFLVSRQVGNGIFGRWMPILLLFTIIAEAAIGLAITFGIAVYLRMLVCTLIGLIWVFICIKWVLSDQEKEVLTVQIQRRLEGWFAVLKPR